MGRSTTVIMYGGQPGRRAARGTLHMKWTGKLLELIGMVVVAAGFLYGVQYSLVRFELGALAIGGLIFYIGWLIEKRT